MHFKEIKPTEHYLEHHSNIPWYKVVEVILTSKQRRKKGDKIVIKKDNNYVLCRLKDKTLWVINAK